jgi:HK97 gp10 family phage protein
MAKLSPKKGQMIYLTGQKELDRQLKGLAVAVQKKLFRKAAREAARPILAAAKKYAPSAHKKFKNRDKQGRFRSTRKSRTGTLLKAIKLRAMKRSRSGRIGVQITLGEGYFKGKSYYGAFVELGTAKQKEQGFMRRAADDNREKAANIFQREIERELLAEVAKG